MSGHWWTLSTVVLLVVYDMLLLTLVRLLCHHDSFVFSPQHIHIAFNMHWRMRAPSPSQNFVSRHYLWRWISGGWFQPHIIGPSVCNPSYSDVFKLPMASIIPVVAQEMDEELEQMWAHSLRGITTIDPGEWKMPGPDNFCDGQVRQLTASPSLEILNFLSRLRQLYTNLICYRDQVVWCKCWGYCRLLCSNALVLSPFCLLSY